MAETVVYTPEQQANNLLPYALMNNNGFFGGNGGSAFWGALLGSVIPGVFGAWGGNGFGNLGGGNAAAASALGAQATANNNAEMIMNAINGTDADVRLLATTLNSDVDSLRLGVNTIQGAIAQVSAQTGLTGLQIQNAIQAGDANLASQLCQCCCENRLATCQQTNELNGSILTSGQRTVDAIADLKTTMVKEFCDAKERDMQDKINAQGDIITQLRNQLDNDRQTAQIAAMIAPLQQEVNDIKCKQPSTATVTYPNLVAVNATPYVSGGYYQGGFNGYYGGGVPGFNF